MWMNKLLAVSLQIEDFSYVRFEMDLCVFVIVTDFNSSEQ